MKSHPARLLCTAAFLSVGLIIPAHSAPDAPAPAAPEAAASPWHKNLDQALTEAKAKGLLVFVEFTGSDWCAPCQRLDAEVYSKPEFLTAATKEFVLVRLDYPRKNPLPVAEMEHNKQVAGRYKVNSYPTALVLDAEGKEIVRHSGYKPGGPGAFLAFLKQEITAARDPETAAKRKAERLANAMKVPPYLKLWRTDWDQALADARAQGRYVLAFYPAPYHAHIKDSVDVINHIVATEEFTRYVSANYVPALLGPATLDMEEAWDDATRNTVNERMRKHRLKSITCFAIVDPEKDRSYITVATLDQPKDFQLIPALDAALAKTKTISSGIKEAMALPTGPEKAKRLDALIGARENARSWATSFKDEAAAIMESDPDGSLLLRPKYALRVDNTDLHNQLDRALATKDADAAMKAISDFEKKHGITEGSEWEGATLQYRAQFYGRIGDHASEEKIRQETTAKYEALRKKDSEKSATAPAKKDETPAPKAK